MIDQLPALASAIDVLVAVVVLACSYLAWEWMTAHTRHCFRVVYGILGIAAAALLGVALWPGHESWAPWVWRAMGLGFAGYMVLDRRRVDRALQAKAVQTFRQQAPQ